MKYQTLNKILETRAHHSKKLCPKRSSILPRFITKVLTNMIHINSKEQERILDIYIRKMVLTTKISNQTILLALNYIHSLAKQHPKVSQCGNHIRLFNTSLILADSILNDNPYSIKAWSLASGLPTSELVKMKHQFCSLLDYRLTVDANAYGFWLNKLEQFLAMPRSNIKTYQQNPAEIYQKQPSSVDLYQKQPSVADVYQNNLHTNSNNFHTISYQDETYCNLPKIQSLKNACNSKTTSYYLDKTIKIPINEKQFLNQIDHCKYELQFHTVVKLVL
ncbi:hypothetical protein HDU92_006293 [Lobulomyces angularis]|nr:hypothetical protein HDU92_006293 [Lobulomyces angularis]